MNSSRKSIPETLNELYSSHVQTLIQNLNLVHIQCQEQFDQHNIRFISLFSSYLMELRLRSRF